MNFLGAKRTPFLFFINFNKDNILIYLPSELVKNDIEIDFPSFKTPSMPLLEKKPIVFEKKPISFENYLLKYHKVNAAIKSGNTYLLNLTQKTPISCNLSLNEIYQSANSLFKVRYAKEWLFFSPEKFITIEKNKLTTYPMKGTIDASMPNAEALILGNKKETSEHNTIIDLLRNDISIVGKQTKVEKYRFVSEINTNEGKLLQVSSAISAILSSNWKNKIGTILDKLTPAGSITGAPKPKTTELIKQIENYERGFYTGISGYFDGNKLETCVNIRFIENTEGGMVFKSGGGIHLLSDPKEEYEEMIKKVYLPFL